MCCSKMWHFKVAVLMCFALHLSSTQVVEPNQQLEGEGVCRRQTVINQFVTDQQYVSKVAYFRARCGSSPCQKSKSTFSYRTFEKNIPKQVQETYCCEGYKQLNKTHCGPVCEPECLFGKCTSPQTCTCDLGYDKHNTSECLPVCTVPCHNGTCVAPEVCECNDGFRRNETTKLCDPTCSRPCQRGHCSAPNTCTCFKGYAKVFWDSYRCNPVCDPPCVNGICFEPDKCACNQGYVEDEQHKHICKPDCLNVCINGFCSAPDQCSCHSGYRRTNVPNICKAVCDEECINGICQSPNHCMCNIGYSKETGTKCVPFCSKGCVNGNCSEPDVCQCFPGYDNKDSVLSNSCEPVCESCIDGVCVSPNVCVCNKGFQMSTQSNACEPVCSKSCSNGFCSHPNTCTCLQNYRPDPLDAFFCLPVCEDKCENGECTAPNECSCFDKYRKNETHTHICEPVCSKLCVNGMCYSPDVCACNYGFEQDKFDKFSCKPFCSDGCLNGICVSPEVCSCFAGFENPEDSNSTCVPRCEKHCENGVCSDPDSCTCLEGFIKDLIQWNKCNPQCISPCENSICTKPNHCECFEGYVPESKHKCSPHCQEECINGICSAPGYCKCFWGFTKEENSSVCSLFENLSTNLNISLVANVEKTPPISFKQIEISGMEEFGILQKILSQVANESLLMLNCFLIEGISLNVNGSNMMICNITRQNENSPFLMDASLKRSIPDLREENQERNNLVKTMTSKTPLSSSSFPPVSSSSSLSYLYSKDSYSKDLSTPYEENSETTTMRHTKLVSSLPLEFRLRTKNLTHKITIVVDIASFIKAEKITVDHFDDTQIQTTSNTPWCLCPNLLNRPKSFLEAIQFYFCPCMLATNDISDESVPLLAFILLGIFGMLFITSITLGMCSRRRLEVEDNCSGGKTSSIDEDIWTVHCNRDTKPNPETYQIRNVFSTEAVCGNSKF